MVEQYMMNKFSDLGSLGYLFAAERLLISNIGRYANQSFKLSNCEICIVSECTEFGGDIVAIGTLPALMLEIFKVCPTC